MFKDLNAAAVFYCVDPLNIQTNRGDVGGTATSVSAGVVTCSATQGCGVS